MFSVDVVESVADDSDVDVEVVFMRVQLGASEARRSADEGPTAGDDHKRQRTGSTSCHSLSCSTRHVTVESESIFKHSSVVCF